MKKVIKIIFLLKLFLVLLSPLKSEEITENTFIIKKVEELGEFIEPKNYPLGMQNLFIAGCNGIHKNILETSDEVNIIKKWGSYLYL